MYGGSTVILNTGGQIRYIIAKSIKSRRREAAQRAYLESRAGREYRRYFEHDQSPAARLRLLHGRRRRAASAGEG